MKIRTKIYCGHDFSEEEGRLNLVVKTCKTAGVPVPQEVYERLNAISDGLNQIGVKAELETNGEAKRYRVKTSEIVNANADFVYFEFSQEVTKASIENEENLDLTDLKIEDPKQGVISKFFKDNQEESILDSLD